MTRRVAVQFLLGVIETVKKPALLELAHQLIIDLIVDRQRPHGRLAPFQERFDHRDAGPAGVRDIWAYSADSLSAFPRSTSGSPILSRSLMTFFT